MYVAVTRRVSPLIGNCELTHVKRQPIDFALADSQHRQYEQSLVAAGCDIERLPASGSLPDSVFVEDTAVVLDEVAVMARPGAPSRRAEVAAVAEILKEYRSLRVIEPGATLDGGDVLVVGRKVFVGVGSRSNAAGVAQLHELLTPFGYRVTAAKTKDCLHLKSAATRIDERTLVVNPAWVDSDVFADYEIIEIDPSEPAAANVLCINGKLVCAASCPRTRDRLQQRGFDTVPVDISEISKAEGAVTCCSLVFPRHP